MRPLILAVLLALPSAARAQTSDDQFASQLKDVRTKVKKSEAEKKEQEKWEKMAAMLERQAMLFHLPKGYVRENVKNYAVKENKDGSLDASGALKNLKADAEAYQDKKLGEFLGLAPDQQQFHLSKLGILCRLKERDPIEQKEDCYSLQRLTRGKLVNDFAGKSPQLQAGDLKHYKLQAESLDIVEPTDGSPKQADRQNDYAALVAWQHLSALKTKTPATTGGLEYMSLTDQSELKPMYLEDSELGKLEAFKEKVSQAWTADGAASKGKTDRISWLLRYLEEHPGSVF